MSKRTFESIEDSSIAPKPSAAAAEPLALFRRCSINHSCPHGRNTDEKTLFDRCGQISLHLNTGDNMAGTLAWCLQKLAVGSPRLMQLDVGLSGAVGLAALMQLIEVYLANPMPYVRNLIFRVRPVYSSDCWYPAVRHSEIKEWQPPSREEASGKHHAIEYLCITCLVPTRANCGAAALRAVLSRLRKRESRPLVHLAWSVPEDESRVAKCAKGVHPMCRATIGEMLTCGVPVLTMLLGTRDDGGWDPVDIVEFTTPDDADIASGFRTTATVQALRIDSEVSWSPAMRRLMALAHEDFFPRLKTLAAMRPDLIRDVCVPSFDAACDVRVTTKNRRKSDREDYMGIIDDGVTPFVSDVPEDGYDKTDAWWQICRALGRNTERDASRVDYWRLLAPVIMSQAANHRHPLKDFILVTAKGGPLDQIYEMSQGPLSAPSRPFAEVAAEMKSVAISKANNEQQSVDDDQWTMKPVSVAVFHGDDTPGRVWAETLDDLVWIDHRDAMKIGLSELVPSKVVCRMEESKAVRALINEAREDIEFERSVARQRVHNRAAASDMTD